MHKKTKVHLFSGIFLCLASSWALPLLASFDEYGRSPSPRYPNIHPNIASETRQQQAEESKRIKDADLKKGLYNYTLDTVRSLLAAICDTQNHPHDFLRYRIPAVFKCLAEERYRTIYHSVNVPPIDSVYFFTTLNLLMTLKNIKAFDSSCKYPFFELKKFTGPDRISAIIDGLSGGENLEIIVQNLYQSLVASKELLPVPQDTIQVGIAYFSTSPNRGSILGQAAQENPQITQIRKITSKTLELLERAFIQYYTKSLTPELFFQPEEFLRKELFDFWHSCGKDPAFNFYLIPTMLERDRNRDTQGIPAPLTDLSESMFLFQRLPAKAADKIDWNIVKFVASYTLLPLANNNDRDATWRSRVNALQQYLEVKSNTKEDPGEAGPLFLEYARLMQISHGLSYDVYGHEITQGSDLIFKNLKASLDQTKSLQEIIDQEAYRVGLHLKTNKRNFLEQFGFDTWFFSDVNLLPKE